MSKKSSAAVKLQPVAVTERAVGLRSYLLRHQHILDAATIVLLAEVAQSGRCSLWLAANRVFRLPEVTKSLGDRVGEHRVYKTLTFAWRLGAFDGLGLVYKQGAGFIPERQGEEPRRAARRGCRRSTTRRCSPSSRWPTRPSCCGCAARRGWSDGRLSTAVRRDVYRDSSDGRGHEDQGDGDAVAAADAEREACCRIVADADTLKAAHDAIRARGAS